MPAVAAAAEPGTLRVDDELHLTPLAAEEDPAVLAREAIDDLLVKYNMLDGSDAAAPAAQPRATAEPPPSDAEKSSDRLHVADGSDAPTETPRATADTPPASATKNAEPLGLKAKRAAPTGAERRADLERRFEAARHVKYIRDLPRHSLLDHLTVENDMVAQTACGFYQKKGTRIQLRMTDTNKYIGPRRWHRVV
jgi:hypothetical protein